MCWRTIKRDLKKCIAKKDIQIFKLMCPGETPDTVKSGVFEYKYKLNSENPEVPLCVRNETPSILKIEEGYHSIIWDPKILAIFPYMYPDTNFTHKLYITYNTRYNVNVKSIIFVRGFIPTGSTYYISHGDLHVVSDNIVLTEIISFDKLVEELSYGAEKPKYGNLLSDSEVDEYARNLENQ